MLTSIIAFLANYLRQKPFTDVLMVVLIGVFVWSESSHGYRTKDAHDTMREVMKETNETHERNMDRIIGALTGIKQEVRETKEEIKSLPEKKP